VSKFDKKEKLNNIKMFSKSTARDRKKYFFWTPESFDDDVVSCNKQQFSSQ